MNTIISQINQGTKDIFIHVILPYVEEEDLQAYSQINQECENYSYECFIDDRDIKMKINFIKHHPNIVGCSFNIDIIEEKKENGNMHTVNLPHDGLKYLNPNTLKNLFVDSYDIVVDINRFINITNLYILCNNLIESHDIAQLTKLECLILETSHGITGEAFKNMPNLKEMTVSWRDCSEDFFTYLTNLEKLSISADSVVKSEDLKQLIHLKYLDVGNCENIKYIPAEISSNLEHLSLSDNETILELIHPEKLKTFFVHRDSWIGDEIIGSMINLEELSIGSCDNITGKAIVNLSKLKKLELFNLKNVQDDCFINLSNLKELKLDNLKITGKSFNNLQKLRKLTIRSMKNLTDEAFISMSNLKYLEIENCENLTDKMFETLTNLVYLDIKSDYYDEPQYYSFTCKIFENLRKLEELSIANCNKMTDFKKYSSFENNLKSLKILDISNCKNLTNNFFHNLVNLESLHIRGIDKKSKFHDILTNRLFKNMGKLRVIWVFNCHNISNKFYKFLPDPYLLRDLRFSQDMHITDKILKKFPNIYHSSD